MSYRFRLYPEPSQASVLDRLVEAVSTRGSEADERVVRAALDLALSTLP